MVSPFVPGLQINASFARATTAQLQNLSAFIIGPNAYLQRYSESTEKENGKLGQYDPAGTLIAGVNQTSYSWPGLPTGAEIDIDYTKLFVDNGLFQYWNQPGGTMEFLGGNEIKHPTKNFVTNGAFAASVDFGDREVQVGDRVLVTGTATSGAFELATYVLGFTGDFSASAVGPAVSEANNAAAIVGTSAAVTPDAGNSGDVDLTGDATSYSGFASGNISETYLIEVTQASTGGDATTGRLKVTSASGLDEDPVVIPLAYGAAFAVGNRGFEITLDDTVPGSDLVVGESWSVVVSQEYTLPTVAVAGTYSATDETDREYLVEILQGAAPADGPVVRVSATAGNDDAQSVILVDGGGGVMDPVSLGSYGLTIQFTLVEGLVTGDKWTVQATASAPTDQKTLKLAHSLPLDVAVNDAGTADLDVTLFISRSLEIPARSLSPGVFNYTASNTELLVIANILVELSDWTVSGTPVPLPLVAPTAMGTNVSVLYANYRAWYAMDSAFKSASSMSDAGVPGVTHEDNPLSYALSKAFGTAEGRPIYWFNVGNPDSQVGWDRALQAASETRNTYGFVPLTRDSTILGNVVAHVESLSSAEFNRPRVAWLTSDDVTEAAVLDASLSTDGLVVMGTITDDPDTTGTQHTLLNVTSANSEFVASAVRAGDMVRFGFATDLWGDVTYEQYTVSSVVNESTLLLATGPSFSEPVPRKMEIHRTLTTAERVTAYQTAKAPYADYKLQHLFFGTMLDGSEEVPSYFAAAALAGMRSAFAPHQALTRSAVAGFTGVKDYELFSTAQLNTVSSSGGFIISPNDTGSLIVRHGVTTGPFDDVNQREESIPSNLHSIIFFLFDLFDPYIGKANAVDETIAMIRAELEAAKSFLRSANYAPGLGGQIIDMIITDVRPSPVSKDSVLVKLELQLPGPINRITVDLLVV